ncbi:TRAP transporter small permease [Puniceibacterium sp. IMCC21224]|uniref:TRAP transporter small permease n=1 Tax=Puniceibacterium sp. IMCC21224 TaxID=1618204 RepID=UPI00065D3BA2|nr:TRAP transporter small permease [Puniceibacterium sp. IMCC21224]KMK68301.1 TRAP-type C4-dicarboxylate transport system, small permease component [Puniceibacterium sp. IMCC21224]
MFADRLVTSILTRADTGARYLVMLGAAAMVAVVSGQVVMRYVFNGSFDWADEVSRIAFVWTIFLAIPLGIRDGTHVGIELLVNRFPPALRKLVARVMNALAAAMMFVVFWTSIIVALATWSERLGAINITSSVFFFPVILGALHSALHLAHMAVFPSQPEAKA